MELQQSDLSFISFIIITFTCASQETVRKITFKKRKMSEYSSEHIIKQNKINKEVSLKLSKLESCYKQNKAILNQTLKNDNRITNLERNLKRVMDKMDILNVSYEQVNFENYSI